MVFTVALMFLAANDYNGSVAEEASKRYWGEGARELSAAGCHSSSCSLIPILGMNWAEWLGAFCVTVFMVLELSLVKYIILYF